MSARDWAEAIGCAVLLVVDVIWFAVAHGSTPTLNGDKR